MRRLLSSSSLALALATVSFQLVHAQEPAAPDPGALPSEAAEPDDAVTGSEQEMADESGELAEPAPPDLGLATTPASPTIPDPADAAARLAEDAPASVEKRSWTLPETVFHLHGYMRLRGTFLRDGALGHRPGFDRLRIPNTGVANPRPNTNYDPFAYFTPDDSTSWRSGASEEGDTLQPVAGGCGDETRTGQGSCGKRGQVSGDLRLRLKPEIHLSDDVRIKAWIDVLDNVGLGTMGYGPDSELSGDSAIRARRVWGEARNRDIGELRFGRMGADWGLGILDNGGDRNGIDSDFSTEVDRIMGITHLGGFYLMAAYDWASEGKVLGKAQSPSAVPVDAAQADDRDAITLAVARKLDAEVQQSAVARGESVFNYGLYFIYRNQLLRRNASVADGGEGRYLRVDERQFIPDLWFQVLWEGLRVEVEAVAVAGSIEGGCPRLEYGANAPVRNALEVPFNDAALRRSGSCKLRQFGVALEAEYRLFDERLGLHFMSGLATGDSDSYGLAATNDPQLQRSGAGTVSNTVSTYQFHPDYRIDLILWRTVMRRVAGAYYFRPGLSYDFIRDPFGQLAGGRLDVVYSRATSAEQTWGQDANLGLEIDVSLYYRSEDGPDVLDGFYGLVQWGILFPFRGLGYADDVDVNTPNKKNAMVLRAVAGIAF